MPEPETKFLATRALELASAADQKINSHETYCEERDGKLHDKIDGVSGQVEKVKWAFITGMGALILVVMGSTISMLIKG